MFENCTTIMELNQERTRLRSQGYSIMEINGAYNRARRNLMGRSSAYKQIDIQRYSPEQLPPYSPAAYLGNAKNSMTLRVEPNGVYL